MTTQPSVFVFGDMKLLTAPAIAALQRIVDQGLIILADGDQKGITRTVLGHLYGLKYKHVRVSCRGRIPAALKQAVDDMKWELTEVAPAAELVKSLESDAHFGLCLGESSLMKGRPVRSIK